MAVARRDDNHVPVILGVSSVDGITPIMARINPITGALLIQIVATSAGPAVTQVTRALHDENHVTTALGITNDANQTPVCWRTSSGNLAIDMV